MRKKTKSLIFLVLVLILFSIYKVSLADNCETDNENLNYDLNLSGLTSDQAIAVINAKYDAIIADPSTYAAYKIPPPAFPAQALNPNYINMVNTSNTIIKNMVAQMNKTRQLAIDEYNDNSTTFKTCTIVTNDPNPGDGYETFTVIPNTNTVTTPNLGQITTPPPVIDTTGVQPPPTPVYVPPTPPLPVAPVVTTPDTTSNTTPIVTPAPVAPPITATPVQHKKKTKIPAPVINYTVQAIPIPTPQVSAQEIQKQSAKVDQNWFQSVLQAFKNIF